MKKVAIAAMMLLGCERAQPDWKFDSRGDGTVRCECTSTKVPPRPDWPPPGPAKPAAAPDPYSRMLVPGEYPALPEQSVGDPEKAPLDDPDAEGAGTH